MMSPEANLRLLRRASWSGFVYIAFLMVGILPLARFFPSQPPSWGAAQIAEIYQDNSLLIKMGMVLVLVGSMFYVPWTAILAKLIAGVEGRVGLLTMCQLIAGTTNVLLTAYPAGWWLTAAFRGDRSPDLVLLLNDIAWLQFLGVIAPFYFVVLSLIYASFADSDPDPLIPRWVGWFNVFFMLDLIPLSIIFFFKTGPFAWNGLFGFYLPFVTFCVWFFVMTYTIRKALPRLADTRERIPA
ncbi:hypothetical protein FHT40_000223 [Mycolicibacterium sp. BK556]|uniref:hypothetical protein n=1 Tax=unclassified Mycolicibacterium TaxID=2636767 RepID=UPI001608AA40|nr:MULTISPECIES: hypothetical protein [unclassified Mycolicibacterium]MBB3600590.1 hypothetical protein [Mycolicibacterium sp. BK556]MBB3630343.1 hypothetical protein [Mycolicibacterium sp. BK607]MBB3748342.1 hypothetical protein [Mycolicibacterium sp. BK634]